MSETPVTTGGRTVRVAVLAPAVMVTDVEVDTPTVVTGNVVEVVPTGTVTEVGTVVDGSLEDKATGTPPAGAAPLIVTVASEDWPPLSELGTRES